MSLPSQAASPPHAAGQIRPSSRAEAATAAGSTPATAQDRAVQRQLAERQIALGRIRRQRAHADQERQRDRQIEMAALLGQIRGREIDRDALGRQAEARARRARCAPARAIRRPPCRAARRCVNAGSPALICTWTSTSLTSIPENATVRIRATPSAEGLSIAIV